MALRTQYCLDAVADRGQSAVVVNGPVIGTPALNYGPRRCKNSSVPQGMLRGICCVPASEIYCLCGRMIISLAFSAIMIVGAFVLPDTIVGMIEASTTRSPSIP